LQQAKARAKRIQCVSDLKQTGLASHEFANDHGGKFPMLVSTNDGGSLEFVTACYQTHGPIYFSFQLFRPLAGELGTSQILACPADLWRWPAQNFSQFDDRNLSYVISLQADPTSLAGYSPEIGWFFLPAPLPVTWIYSTYRVRPKSSIGDFIVCTKERVICSSRMVMWRNPMTRLFHRKKPWPKISFIQMWKDSHRRAALAEQAREIPFHPQPVKAQTRLLAALPVRIQALVPPLVRAQVPMSERS
jgi:hypothetical protein